MGFDKGAALLRHFKRPQWFRSKTWRQSQTRPYIVPTGFGFAFGTLALIQLIMAIASQNNLIYLFVFSEISVALASMFFTNNNIYRLKVNGLQASSCFANEENWIEVTIGADRPCHQLFLRWNFQKEGTPFPPSATQTQLCWIPKRRGVQKFPALTFESSFPFNLLRAWRVERFPQEVLVFPQRKGNVTFPQDAFGDRSLDHQGLFRDLRVFQRGDWPRRIDWRASQRSQSLMIRQFEEEAAVQMEFHWHQTRSLENIEDRISQLALWVDLAERNGALYTLKIGAWSSGKNRGPQHWTQCLEYLATLEASELK